MCYLESVPVSASIRIITQNMTGKFEAVAKRFGQERNRFEVRVCQVHDRYLIVDDRAWIIGQSLKDAGKKPLAIMELTDTDQRGLYSRNCGTWARKSFDVQDRPFSSSMLLVRASRIEPSVLII